MSPVHHALALLAECSGLPACTDSHAVRQEQEADNQSKEDEGHCGERGSRGGQRGQGRHRFHFRRGDAACACFPPEREPAQSPGAAKREQAKEESIELLMDYEIWEEEDAKEVN